MFGELLALLALSFEFQNGVVDWVATAGFITALAAAAKVFLPARTESTVTTQQVDGDVLAQFLGVTDRLADLELDLAALRLELLATQQELAKAQATLKEMQNVEGYLRAELILKNEQIATLRARVLHLEEACERAGLNDHITTEE